MNNSFSISGNIIDVVKKNIFKGRLTIESGRIKSVEPCPDTDNEFYILPGLIDSHVHIESSMLTPGEFARAAVVHGTTGVVADPHEIANVLGIAGVDFMIENGKKVPFRFFFGAPSCVPATPFESAGANINSGDTDSLLKKEDIYYLAEMMNFPGVINNDKEVLSKIEAAKKHNKVIDGHAPGLRGKPLEKYINAGITTDHECFSLDEAVEKINKGMKILIREGSAAKNFDDLAGLINDYPDSIMLCSDDKHPDDLIEGHINLLIKRALKKGYNLFDVLRSACFNPKEHYGLNNGLLLPGDNADFIIIDNPDDFNVLQTYVGGVKVAENGKTLVPKVAAGAINKFNCSSISKEDLLVKADSENINIIEAIDGQLITKKTEGKLKIENGNLATDVKQDVLKIVVINRYNKSKPSIAYIKGFGLKDGALASTIAHDSHNIIAIGTNDEDILKAINLLVDSKGGIAYANNTDFDVLPLPVAGLMANEDASFVAEKYKMIDRKVKKLGSKLKAPFMTLSFMALLVIPEIKISDKGLFDGEKFEFISLFKK